LLDDVTVKNTRLSLQIGNHTRHSSSVQWAMFRSNRPARMASAKAFALEMQGEKSFGGSGAPAHLCRVGYQSWLPVARPRRSRFFSGHRTNRSCGGHGRCQPVLTSNPPGSPRVRLAWIIHRPNGRGSAFTQKSLGAGRSDRMKNAAQACDTAWGWGPPRAFRWRWAGAAFFRTAQRLFGV